MVEMKHKTHENKYWNLRNIKTKKEYIFPRAG